MAKSRVHARHPNGQELTTVCGAPVFSGVSTTMRTEDIDCPACCIMAARHSLLVATALLQTLDGVVRAGEIT